MFLLMGNRFLDGGEGWPTRGQRKGHAHPILRSRPTSSAREGCQSTRIDPAPPDMAGTCDQLAVRLPIYSYSPAPLSPELGARIPGVDVPDELMLPEAATENFHRFARILGQQENWFLMTTFDSIYPIPAGWTITGTGDEDCILKFSKGGIASDEEPEIVIRVGGFWGDYQTSEEPLSEALDAISQDPRFSLVKQEVVDAKKAYVFYEIEPESGNNEYALIVFSQSPRDNEFRTIFVFVDVQDWDEYYPIIRAIHHPNWQ